MKLIRNAIFALLLCLLCMLVLRSAQPLRDPGRVWVGGQELTGGGEARVGGGSAVYDPATGTLTMTDAVLSGDFRGAAIYAEGDLTIVLAGDSSVEGKNSGCTVLGDLTVAGQGTLTLSGAKSGAAVHGCITVFDSAQLDLRGQKPLRWGKLHISPLDTVFHYEGRMQVRAPNTVYLTDGAADAAGNPLTGEPTFESFALKLGEPVPEPAEPGREGYWFGGWFADPELTEPFDFSLERSSPVTLYARWIRIVTLSFDSWGGEELPDELFAWGDVPDQQPVPSREGYRFTAWYADERLREVYDWSQPLEGDRTIYAKWEKNADITLCTEATEAENRLFHILKQKYRKNKLALIIRLLQLETNPKLLLNNLTLADFSDILDISGDIDEIDYVDYSQDVQMLIESIAETSKFQLCINRAKELHAQGKPIIIWCIFIDSIHRISKELERNGITTGVIYGNVSDEQRAAVLSEFKSGDIDVLITNPHTLAESVSLHGVCHDAIYYEYSYNLVHLLQSKDRIHRLGLPDGQYTQYYYLEEAYSNTDGTFTLGERIYNRLREKEQIMLNAIENQVLEKVTSTEEDLNLIFSGLGLS